MKAFSTRLIALLLVVFLSSVIVFAQSAIEGRVIAWTLNVRSAPDAGAENVIGQLRSQTVVLVEGRTPATDWFYIRTEDGALAGWAAAQFIAIDNNLLGNVPAISEGQIIAPQGGAVVDPLDTTLQPGSLDLIMNTPILHNFTSSTVYTVFARGQRLGNNPRSFMLVGDSVTATQPFLYGFSDGNYNLGPYADLQATIDWFNVSPARNISSSWNRTSVAAVNGFVSGAVFDGTWSPEYCGALVPLDCEYDIMQPSVAIVLLGGQDVRLFDALFFQVNMRRIARQLKNLGVIPVFTTFPMHASYRPEQTVQFNSVVINVANEQDIPVINLYRALQALPDGGAKPDDVVHLTQGETYFNFNGDEAVYGVTLRNLLTLQALDILRREVL